MNRIIKKLQSFTASMRFMMMATYFIVILITLILMIVYVIGLLHENLYEEKIVEMYAKANIISESVSNVWTGEEYFYNLKFSSIVEKSLAGTNIRGVITDVSYTVLYDTNRESQLSGKVFMREVIKGSFDGYQGDMISDTESGIKMLTVAVPVKLDDNITGCVYLAQSVAAIDKTITRTRTSLIVFCIVISILIGMLSFVMSYIVTSPLEKFREVAKYISRGDFSKRVQVKGQNEIAQMGEALNYMCDELEHLEEKRRKFVSDASHELKTPMAGIKLICDTILSQDTLNTDMVKEFLGDMNDEVDRLTRIIQRLLVLTKLDSGKGMLKLEEADLVDIVKRIIKKLRPMATEKNIEIQEDFHDIPFLPMVLDYDKITEAIYNVLDNAIKYSIIDSNIKVSIQEENNTAVISIADSGDGIPEAEREHIFERFYRLDDSRARDTGGTGLGLAIAKEAILKHNGTIAVKGREEKGSIFVIRLPITNNQKMIEKGDDFTEKE